MRALGIAMIVAFLGYTVVLFSASRRRDRPPIPAPPDLLFVFVVPCLDEELVIADALERLGSISGYETRVLVIDDGSTDRTADVVRRVGSPRVSLLCRVPPDARQGKGAALNAAMRHLLASGDLADRDEAAVIVGVLDADGRLEPNALFEVAHCFADPSVAAVQIGVRMYNAGEGLLPRLQDFEFVTFTEVFQRARTRLGVAGMGGNGQFNRLSALRSLGDEPWSDCLTEDLDLGIRLLAAGWRTTFCGTTWVNQQGVTTMRRFVRQRSRWFQGHLQCWRRAGLVLRSSQSVAATADLLHHLFSPLLILVTSISTAAFATTLAVLAIVDPQALSSVALLGHRAVLLVAYALTFALALPYAFCYWLQTRSVSFLRALALGHAYVVYGYLWFVASWLAVGRIVLRRRGWAKTSRTPAPARAEGPWGAGSGAPTMPA